MSQCRLVVDRIVIAEFSGGVPCSLLRIFTPELFCGRDSAGLVGRRSQGQGLLTRLTEAGWSSERAIVALGDQIELALEAYAALPERVRQQLGWPAQDSLANLDAHEWIRRFATAAPEDGRWLGTIAGGTHPGLLLRACLRARPLAQVVLWVPENQPSPSVPLRRHQRQAGSAGKLVLLEQRAKPAYQRREQP